MRRAAAILQACVRGAGLILLVLGVLFWTGTAAALIPLHIALGVIFVLALLALAVLALRQGGGGTLPVVAMAWAVLVWLLGFAQGDLLPGAIHWVVKTLHLVVGVAAIGLGEAVGGRLRRQQAAGDPGSA